VTRRAEIGARGLLDRYHRLLPPLPRASNIDLASDCIASAMVRRKPRTSEIGSALFTATARPRC